MNQLLPIIRRQRRPLVPRSLAELPVEMTPEPPNPVPAKVPLAATAATKTTEPAPIKPSEGDA